MEEDFFSDYKDFVICSVQSHVVDVYEFCPENYAAHYILTLSLYDPLISSWQEANRYEIEVTSSLKKVLAEFNREQKQLYHLTLLECEAERSYCVMALSCKNKMDSQEASIRISDILDTIILTPLYVGHRWYRLIGTKGRLQRKLFTFLFKKYSPTNRHSNPESKNSKLIPYPTSHIHSMEG